MNYQQITGNKIDKPFDLANISKKELVYISRSLSKVLRHTAISEGLEVDDEGYIKVTDILKLKRFSKANFDIIKKVVDTNDKKRFSLKNDNGIWYIKANQGHSFKLENPNLKKVMSPSEIPIVVHGTFEKYLKSILDMGLITKGRNHIHFAKGLFGDKNVISGMRYNYEIAIYIDAEKAMNDGIEFFISENEVILSSGINNKIERKYFKKICRRNGEEINFNQNI